ncbi:MAG: hypothetical protein ACU0AU_04130 [Cognatishimia activa]
MAKFQFLRLSLSVPPVGPLNLVDKNEEPRIVREEYLRNLFSNRFDFFHSGRLFSFVPSPSNQAGQPFLAGFIGKQVEEMVQSGPEELFAVTRNKHWKASFVAIDVRSHEQVVAFEKRQDVGASQAILNSLVESYGRSLETTTWHVDIEYIQRVADFWEAAKENTGIITELVFEFHPPNGLRGFDSFKNFDRIAKQQANGDSSSYSVKNADGGVRPEGEFVESAAEYATEGAGGIKLKSGRKTLFDSRKSKKEDDIPESLMPRQGETAKILGLIDYLFGRRK